MSVLPHLLSTSNHYNLISTHPTPYHCIIKIVLSLINNDPQLTQLTNASKSLSYLILLWPLLLLITPSLFPLWLWRLLFILLLVLHLWPYILSVSCRFAFLCLPLDADVLEDSILSHLFTLNLFPQQSKKFLLFKISLYMSLTPKLFPSANFQAQMGDFHLYPPGASPLSHMPKLITSLSPTSTTFFVLKLSLIFVYHFYF